jgi:peptide/nickel transport system permease protein
MSADLKVLAAGAPPAESLPLLRAFGRQLGKQPAFTVAVGIVLLIALAGIFGPVLLPNDPFTQDLSRRVVPPAWYGWLYGDPRASSEHLLGTDRLGRDYLSRLVYGARISLFVGVSAAAISALIGTTLGLLAGYFGGRVDRTISLLLTVRLSVPVILVALAIVATSGGSLFTVTVVLGLLIWDRFAVVIRSGTQEQAKLDYVVAAQAAGCSEFKIMVAEVLPNLAGPFLVVLTLEIAHAILLEAALSFLGMGVEAPLPSWGLMLAEGRPEMYFNPWLVMIPGLALFVLIYAINTIGDDLRKRRHGEE